MWLAACFIINFFICFNLLSLNFQNSLSRRAMVSQTSPSNHSCELSLTRSILKSANLSTIVNFLIKFSKALFTPPNFLLNEMRFVIVYFPTLLHQNVLVKRINWWSDIPTSAIPYSNPANICWSSRRLQDVFKTFL